jgi:acetolactate synthase I/II/III large subunit
MRREKAEKPLIISAMKAVRGEESLVLTKIAEKLAVPVCGAWRRFSSFPNEHSNFIGSIGLGSPKVTINALKEADFIIGLGQSMEDIAVSSGDLLREGTEIVQVAKSIDSGSVRRSGRSKFQGIIASELGVLQALLQICAGNVELSNKIKEKHQSRTSQLRQSFENRFTEEKIDTVKADMNLVFTQLNRVIENNAIVTSDAGNFAHWLLRYITFDEDRVYLGPVNGAMGYGIPSALGAKVSLSDRPVWAITGDGGAMMTIGDLETIKRHELDVSIIVVNNGTYGTIRAHQEKHFPNRSFGTNIGDVNFAKVAEGMGWKSWRIENNDQIERVLTEAVNQKGPRLIEVTTSVYPLGLG